MPASLAKVGRVSEIIRSPFEMWNALMVGSAFAVLLTAVRKRGS